MCLVVYTTYRRLAKLDTHTPAKGGRLLLVKTQYNLSVVRCNQI